MITVITDAETAREIIAVGVYGDVVKPIDQNRVLISVANALRRRELGIGESARRRMLESHSPELRDLRTAWTSC